VLILHYHFSSTGKGNLDNYHKDDDDRSDHVIFHGNCERVSAYYSIAVTVVLHWKSFCFGKFIAAD